MRYTRKFLEARAERACKAIGLDWGPHYERDDATGRYRAVVGRVQLAKGMSGWNLEQIANEGGAVSQLNGWCNSMTAAELVAWCDGVTFAAERMAKG